MVVALAGRRPDPPNAEKPRFPVANAPHVQQRIRQVLIDRKAELLVCSAACGADLLALECAGELGLRRRVILPFERNRFRAVSVVDRPGDWGARFERVLDEVEARGDLVVLNYSSDDPKAYHATNRRLLQEGRNLARETGRRLLVVVVWDGTTRRDADVTADFRREARRLGLPVSEVKTI